MIVHPIPPLYDENSRILLLGSFPSVRSREEKFFYAHPQNRFWRVLSEIFGESVPETIEQKRELALRNHIALWDVLASCEITGSADGSIKSARPNDISPIIRGSKIEKIFTNGKTAYGYYKKFIESEIGREAACLPSTSPANAAYSFDMLCEIWKRAILGE